MKTTHCESFLETPDLFENHPNECPECAALVAELDRMDSVISGSAVERPLVAVDPAKLPVAAWEGSSYRPWSIVLAAFAILGATATLLFVMAGIPPLEGFRAVFLAHGSRLHLFQVAEAVGQTLQKASWGTHLAILASFLLVNFLFFRMLRRAPKGIDAPTR